MRVNLPSLEQHEIGRPKHRFRNPIKVGVLYLFRNPIDDVYQVKAGSALNLQILFTIPIGQQYTPNGGVAVAKSSWHTSMTQGSLLPNPQKYFTKYISVSVRGDTVAADLIRFLDDTLVTFTMARPFLVAHASKLPGAGGPFGFTSAIVSNGWPDKDNEFAFSDQLGEVIEQGQAFSVTMDPTLASTAGADVVPYVTTTGANGGTGINARVTLDGLLNREVL